MTPPPPAIPTERGAVAATDGEIVPVPRRQAAAAGAIGGLVVGAMLGSLIGALLAWLAGAVLDWQRDLAFTLGVARRLLPFGDQIAFLRTVDTFWWVAIPTVALALSLVTAVFGALLTTLVASTYNRSRRRVRIRITVSPGPDNAAAAQPVQGGPKT